MRRTAGFLLEDVTEVERLVAAHPWATLVSPTSVGLVASHYPVILEQTDDASISLLTHLGRPDDVAHEVGQHEMMVVVAGPHGYVSPSWYPPGEVIPTWNHVTAHLWGTPQVLSDEENLAVLRRLVDLFEAPMPAPRSLDLDEALARRAARGTVGLRIPVSRFDARAKLSQNKPPGVVSEIIARLEGDGPYASAGLAAEMRHHHGLAWPDPSPPQRWRRSAHHGGLPRVHVSRASATIRSGRPTTSS